MILGLSSATYGGVIPEDRPLAWLLDRCAVYGLRALEAGLPQPGKEDPTEVRRKAGDLGIRWVGYWSDDFVTPEGGRASLRERAERAFDAAIAGGVRTLVTFGQGSRHNRFTKEPPRAEQHERMVEHLGPVAEAASARGLKLGLLPHLDYRGHELVSVMRSVNHPALRMAFDTANPLPVCEEPVEAAKVVLPHAIAVALKDVQVFPHRSNDVTIWGTPIGQGSVDFKAILPMLPKLLPNPEGTTVSVKLRLRPGDTSRRLDEADFGVPARAPGPGRGVARGALEGPR